MSGTTYEPFVEGWDFVETLGEGAYGEVRLAINRKTQEAVAVKIVNADRLKGNDDNLRKEVCIHQMLQRTESHENIIRFFGQRTENKRKFLFLEYAPGGELFDRIEPDVGMPMAQAHKYFKQLIDGVEFMHSCGVCHRDIKPENLLLDIDGKLKITDFGLSTVFRHQGRERKLERCCGTPPYVAPEVLQHKEYQAEPSDLWSCGIVLTAMICGELPWDEPLHKCKEFVYWEENKLISTPWTKIDRNTLRFLRKLLNTAPLKRLTIPEIKKDPWYLKCNGALKSKSPRSSGSPRDSQSIKRFCSGAPSPLSEKCENTRLSSSQPNPYITIDEGGGDVDESCTMFISQPLHPEDMLLSQIASTPGSSQNPFSHLIKRLTRFNINLGLEEGVKAFLKVVAKLMLQYKIISQNQVRIFTIDKRKSTLTYQVNFILVGQLPLLVDFRMSKGDGLEFKRQFKNIKEQMKEFLV